MPAVVLAAKRAANTGKKTIVATSIESSDDVLVEILERNHIPYFRGSLDNTLQRFVQALADYDDESIVFRLTADNVIPDGYLLDELEADFIKNNHSYLACNGEQSGLPYGMSVEVTRAKHLRTALSSNPTSHEAEHVTPRVIATHGASYFSKYQTLQMGHYRCTIDCLDDYLIIAKLFEKLESPIKENSFDIIQRLKLSPGQPTTDKPANRMVLGTAQLGLAYGINNRTGKPGASECCQLIKLAITNGVNGIDTARAYGDSENIIGEVLRHGWNGRTNIITKLSPLTNCPPNADEETVISFVDASLYHSMSALSLKTIDTLLVHRSSHLDAWNGSAWRRLCEHRDQGRIKSLGASVQNPAELIKALDNSDIRHIQMPFNIMDWRWENSLRKIATEKSRRSIKVHVRSALLQGLLASKEPKQWAAAHMSDASDVLQWLDFMQIQFERESIADLCIGFVLGHPWVDGIVIGSENRNQLEQNIRLSGKPPLNLEQIAHIASNRPRINESTLDPASWIFNTL